MVLCAGQDYMADHNQQYLVEMDGNQAAGVLFKVRDVHSLFCFFLILFLREALFSPQIKILSFN